MFAIISIFSIHLITIAEGGITIPKDDCRWLVAEDFETDLKCDGNEVAVGSCASGFHADCPGVNCHLNDTFVPLSSLYHIRKHCSQPEVLRDARVQLRALQHLLLQLRRPHRLPRPRGRHRAGGAVPLGQEGGLSRRLQQVGEWETD